MRCQKCGEYMLLTLDWKWAYVCEKCGNIIWQTPEREDIIESDKMFVLQEGNSVTRNDCDNL